MPSPKRIQGGILVGSQAFRYFLWRQRPLSHALRGFVPEILASDGRRVRRIHVGDRFLSMQEYDDRKSADAIAQMVQERGTSRVGLRGYAMYSEHESVAIWNYEGQADPAWVAFPFSDFPGRAAVLGQLPGYADGVARLRLCGGARLRWVSGRLLFEAAIEQRSDGFDDDPRTQDLMDHLVDIRLETTIDKDGEARPIRLIGRDVAATEIQRTSARRVEAAWALNAALYEQFRDNRSLRAWFVLTFDTSLFCLPDPWQQWWFEVGFPNHTHL